MQDSLFQILTKVCRLSPILLLLLLHPETLRGSGFLLGISGARAQGMAGAWVAQGDDPSVLDHNPALLSQFTKPTLFLTLSGYIYEGSFQPKPDPLLGEGPEVRNEKPLSLIPHFFSAVPLGVIVLGAGFYTPVNPSLYQFPSGSPGRYQVLRAENNLGFATLALAYAFAEEGIPLSFALAGDLGYATADMKQNVGVIPGFATLDGTLTVKGSSQLMPRLRAGASYEFAPGFQLGIAYAQGFPIRVRGDLKVEVPVLGVEGKDRVKVTQRYPSELRLGLGYRKERLRAELTLRGYRFSEYRAQTLDLENNSLGGIPIPDQAIPRETRDTVAAQAGIGYGVLKDHEVRVGYMFDPSAYGSSMLSLSEFDANKHLLALGYGVVIKGFRVDMALGMILYETRKVETENPPAGALLGISPPVLSGTYRRNDQFLSLGIGVEL